METQQRTAVDAIGKYIRNSVTLKLFTILIMMLLLMIPVAFVMELINEREVMRQSVFTEVSDKWSNSQKVYGPVLTIPYNRQVLEDGKVKVVREEAHLLPSLLKISAAVEPRTLHRGIYEVVVYDSEISFEGNFSENAGYLSELKNQEVLWEEAFFSIGISDLRGVKEKVAVNVNGIPVPVEPGTQIPELVPSGITVNEISEGLKGNETLNFSFDLQLQGSGHLGFLPLGKETIVNLASPWQSPGFTGSFLPDERTVNKEGFTASYRVLELNRNYPQFWVGDQNAAGLQNSAFGVDLLLPANDYQKATRSAKYALLVVSLTFLTFFLVEVFGNMNVHPFQYILIGLALVLFYLLLISISEHTGFNAAYMISGISVIAITGLYSKAVFRNVRQAMVLVLVLVFVYSFIYLILQLQDYALLIGSLGLTAVLAVTMYITRHVNWYDLNALEKADTSEHE